MTIRVAVPLNDATGAEAGGVSLLVAAAKLLTFEYHEAALQAKQMDMPFDARYGEIEALIDRYMLVRGGDMDGDGLFLAAELEMPVDCMRDPKESMGAFGSDIQLFSMRPPPLLAVEDLRSENIERMLDESGFRMPHDWEHRISSLQRKHYPPPVIGESPRHVRRDPMPMEYTRPSERRCACGNYASGADGKCNECKRQRAAEAAQILAAQLAAGTNVSGSPKRARIGDSSLMRV